MAANLAWLYHAAQEEVVELRDIAILFDQPHLLRGAIMIMLKSLPKECVDQHDRDNTLKVIRNIIAMCIMAYEDMRLQ